MNISLAVNSLKAWTWLLECLLLDKNCRLFKVLVRAQLVLDQAKELGLVVSWIGLAGRVPDLGHQAIVNVHGFVQEGHFVYLSLDVLVEGALLKPHRHSQHRKRHPLLESCRGRDLIDPRSQLKFHEFNFEGWYAEIKL